jgi:hypothetical protein
VNDDKVPLNQRAEVHQKPRSNPEQANAQERGSMKVRPLLLEINSCAVVGEEREVCGGSQIARWSKSQLIDASRHSWLLLMMHSEVG